MLKMAGYDNNECQTGHMGLHEQTEESLLTRATLLEMPLSFPEVFWYFSTQED